MLPRNARFSKRQPKKLRKKSIQWQKSLLASQITGSCKSALSTVNFKRIAHDKNKNAICPVCNPKKRISCRRASMWMKGEEFPVYENAADNPDYNKIPLDPLTHPLRKTK